MTTPSDSPARGDDDDRPGGTDPAPPTGAPGVELGMSDESGGTFEPEEDVTPDS